VKIGLIGLFALLIVAGPAVAESGYKCQDEGGNWYFAEDLNGLPAPCREKIQQETMKKEAEKKARLEAEKIEAERRKLLPPKKKSEKPVESAPAKPAVAEDCSEFSAYLKDCVPFACYFTNVKGKKAKRIIKGLTGTDCAYEEDSSEKMKLACTFNVIERKLASTYFRMLAKAKKVETKTSKDENGATVNVDIIDGKEIMNPIVAGLNSGACEMRFNQ